MGAFGLLAAEQETALAQQIETAGPKVVLSGARPADRLGRAPTQGVLQPVFSPMVTIGCLTQRSRSVA